MAQPTKPQTRVTITSPSNPQENRPQITSPSNPMENGTPSSPSASAGAGSSDDVGEAAQGFDISSLPFQFNPPIHSSLKFLLTDLGEGNKSPNLSKAAFYDEILTSYGEEWARRSGGGKTKFENLRLGRIIMDDRTISAGVRETGTRYGFRFLYNPSSISGTTNVGTDFIPDPRSELNVVIQTGLEQINFEVLLNRIPDVVGNSPASEYQPVATKGALARIKKEGTHYDLDFLYRCANGIHDTRWMKRTGDIGVLLPNPCRLILGPFTSRGAVVGVSATDQMFSADMVPILTTVQISFSRYLSMSPSDESALESLGYTRGESSSTGEDAGDPGSAPPPPADIGSGAPMAGGQVYNLARVAGFSPQDATLMTKIAWLESRWVPRALNAKRPDLSYGLWQINMIDNLGPARRKAYNLKSNTDLWDPVTNARVARKIWQSQGFGAWTTYSAAKQMNKSW